MKDETKLNKKEIDQALKEDEKKAYKKFLIAKKKREVKTELISERFL